MSANDTNNSDGAREVPEDHTPDDDEPDDRPEATAVERGGYIRVTEVGNEAGGWLAIDTASAAERRR